MKKHSREQLSSMQADFFIKKMSAILSSNVTFKLKNSKGVLATELHFSYSIDGDKFNSSFYMLNPNSATTDKQIQLALDIITRRIFWLGVVRGDEKAKKRIQNKLNSLLSNV